MVLCIQFYANLGFQYLIMSNSISFTWPGSIVTWIYSSCLFEFKSLIIYSSDFTNKKDKIIHVF